MNLLRSFRYRATIFVLLFAGGHAAAAAPRPDAEPANLPRYDELSRLDLPALKAVLEKAGWPAEHTQAFLSVEVQTRLNPPFQPRAEDLRTFEFWRTGPDTLPFSHRDTPEQREARLQRADLAQKKFEELYPSDEREGALLTAWEAQREWGDLPEEKRVRVRRIIAEANYARDRLLQSRGGILQRAEWDEVWTLNRKLREQLAAVLSPAELLDYDLRNSQTAHQMREELDAFRPSRGEFIAIFRLRHPLELAFGDKPEGVDEAIDRERVRAAEAVEKQIAEVLGPARADDYQLSSTPECQALQVRARAITMDAATVRELYRATRIAGERLEKLRTEPDGDATARTIRADLLARFSQRLNEPFARQWLSERGLWP